MDETEVAELRRRLREVEPRDPRASEREQRYRELFEHTSDGVFLLDVTGDGRFRVAAFNPAEERLIGISSAVATGKFVDELLPAEVAEAVSQNYRRCVAAGEELSYTEDLALPAGRRLFLTTLVPLKDERGICRRLIGVAHDITEAVATQAALRESEERFRVAFQTVPDALNICRCEDGVMIAVNEGFCRLTGWPEAEAVGVTSAALGLRPVADHDAFLARVVREGAVRNSEVRFRARDGSEFIGRVSTQQFTAAGKSCFLTLTRDITEARRAEHAQAAVYRIAEATNSGGTLREMLREIHAIVSELMPAPNFYIALRESGSLSFPYSVDQRDSEPPAPAASHQSLIGHVLRIGRPLLLNGEEQFEALARSEGFELSGAPATSWIGVPLRTQERTVGVLAAQMYEGSFRYGQRELDLLQFVSTQVARAIERKQAEEAGRISERRFRALIENSSDCTLVCAPDGSVMYRSPSLTRILGYAESEPLQTMAEYVHPDDVAEFVETWREVLAKPGVPVSIASRVRHLNGTWRVLEGVCVNQIADPALGGVVVNFRDATERKQIEARLLAADRMVSIGTLAAGVAHEINNPLAYLIANLALVREAMSADAVAGEALASAQEGAERVRKIVRDLKMFSRADETALEPVDVHQVLDAAANIALSEILPRARLERDYANELPRARGNDARVGQVFLNLLVNAAQAMPEDGSREKLIKLTTRVRDGYIAVEVSDTGSGIAREHLPRLFDPFFTTKPVGVGTGLGLYICQQLLESIGGRISVESELGRGSTFTVLLPIAAGKLAPPPEAATTQAPALALRGRILTVDDEPQIGRALRRALAGYEITSVVSAAAGLQRLRDGERFDLIICDLMMPVLTGMDLHAALAIELPDQARRMIFVTGGAFTARAREFLTAVAPPLLEKPFELRTVRSMVADRLAALGSAQ